MTSYSKRITYIFSKIIGLRFIYFKNILEMLFEFYLTYNKQ